MSRRLGQPNVVFGPTTIFIDFPRSDGDATKYPTNIIRVVDAESQVNFMELLDIDESAQAKKWRASVGKAIATKLEMQGDPNNYVLRDWPQHYRLYDHHKGPAGNPRHDLYLYGCSRSGRFRSINEFIPHAIWLFSDPTMNYANCECKYCTKQPQKGITASMGDILGTPASASPAPRARREKREKKATRLFASVQKVLKPAPKRSAHVLDTPMLAERNSDLRAVFSRNSMKLKRWYRDGEVVWCQLNPPIGGPSGDDSNILFWPGLVQEYKLKSVPVPRDVTTAPPDSISAPLNPDPGPSSTGSTEEGRGTIYDKVERPTFTVEQSTIYLVELFAINKSVHVSDDQVIPYQAYMPSDDVILAMQGIDIERIDFDRDSVSNFNPSPGNQPALFEDAVGPYAVALQIASNVSQFFSATDEWEFQYIAPTPSLASGMLQNRSENSLSAAINAAGRLNSAAATASMKQNNSNSPHLYRNLSGTQYGMSQTDLTKLEDDLLGSSSTTPGTSRTQTRFQGLWWGPERIWVDDFVRLKGSRNTLAPHGAPNISPPAGPSRKATEHFRALGGDISEIGAGNRGAFMRIDALFVVESSSEGRKRKECRASGPLYELVDEDWDENEDELVKQHNLRAQGGAGPSHPTEPPPERAISTPGPQASLPTPSTSTLTSDPIPVISQLQSPPTAPSSSSLLPPSDKSTIPHELPVNYPLPRPPVGYRFRPILTPGHEVILSLGFLSGRYYPGLLMHPLLTNEVTRAAHGEDGVLKLSHLWALDGLNGAIHCSVDPDKFQPSRMRMLERADKGAYSELEAFKRQAIAARNGEEDGLDEEEDVDMLTREDDPISEDERERALVENLVDRDGDVTMQ